MTRRSIGALLLCFAVLGALPFAPAAQAADPPKGTAWTQHYFPSEDGLTMLHADVLRDKDLGAKEKTPVILTVSPYTNHSGQSTDFNPNASGPSDRFYDFLEVGDVIEHGYTYVMVDLPGTGGSSGCNDWGGIREQQAVKAAVEWAASQPWSTGRVGMMGKSYDGWTGLMAIAQQPKGLAAVVSMEPVYSGYRYLYNNGVRFTNSLLTPALFQAIDAKPGSVRDDPLYNAYGAPQVWCYGLNYGLQQDDRENSPFWVERDLLPPSKGAKTPLFLTQGFLETNTKPDAAFDYFNGMAGPKRAWFGQFDHYRGWERDEDGDFQAGRSTFAQEMMRFLDHYVKGVPLSKAPVHRDPVVEVQDIEGRYRAEPSWPPPDARMYSSSLRKGTYSDNLSNSNAVWTISQSLPHDVWLAGEPVVEAKLNALPRANFTAHVYDIAPNGRARVVSRGTHLLRGVGDQKVELELYGQDWPLDAGHRVGVLLSGSSSWWMHVPTYTEVTIVDATVRLPFLTFVRDRFIEGGVTPTLKSYRDRFTNLSQGAIKQAQKDFELPPRLRPRG